MISLLEKNRWFFWTITVLIFAFIFYVSSLSFPPPPAGPPSITATVYHISVFFLLMIFFLISALNRKWRRDTMLLSLLIITVYAALDELHQYFVPGRFTSITDFMLDFTGIAFAALIYFLIVFRKS